MSGDEFDARAAPRAAYESAPVEDDDRADIAAEMGRHVIVELPAAWLREARTDIRVKLPIRVVWDCGMGLGVKIAPYDFSTASVQMLKRAIAFFEHHGGQTRPVEWIPKGTCNAPVKLPADRHHNVVPISLRAYLEPHGPDDPALRQQGVRRLEIPSDDESRAEPGLQGGLQT